MDLGILIERIKKLESRFREEPCAKSLQIELEMLALESARVSMPVSREICTAGLIVQGGIIAVLADYACVYLAMTHSDNFTPLSSLSMEYLRPVVFEKDKFILSHARLVYAGKTRIVTEVRVYGEAGILKAIGRLVFAKRD